MARGGMTLDMPPQGRLANPELNRGTGGFAVDYGDNARAQRETGIDASAFAAEAAAMGNIGKAIENGGEYMAKVADQMIASQNRIAMDQAEISKAEAEREIGEVLANEKDERKWVEKAQEITGRWTVSALEDKSLFPATKQAIAASMKKWEIGLGTRVLRSAHDRSLQRETEGLEGTRIRLLREKQWAQADAVTDVMLERQLIGPDVAEKQRTMADKMKEQDIEEAQTNATIVTTRTQGIDAAYKQIDESGESEINKERNRAVARRIDEEGVQKDADAFANAVALGALNPADPNAITVPDQVDQWEPNNPRITPKMREQAKNYVKGRNATTRKEYIAAHVDELASGLYTEALNFDFERDGKEKYFELRMRIGELPAPVEGEVSGVLEKKFPGRSGPGDMPAQLMNEVERSLTNYFNEEQFGKYRIPQGYKYDDYGEKVTVSDPAAPQKVVINATEYRKALNAKALVGKAMREWAKLNPKKAQDPNAVFEELERQLPAGARIRAADDYEALEAVEDTEERNDGPRIDPAGIMNDFPVEAAGPPENTLIPFPYEE